jgi:hypothetical protein
MSIIIMFHYDMEKCYYNNKCKYLFWLNQNQISFFYFDRNFYFFIFCVLLGKCGIFGITSAFYVELSLLLNWLSYSFTDWDCKPHFYDSSSFFGIVDSKWWGLTDLQSSHCFWVTFFFCSENHFTIINLVSVLASTFYLCYFFYSVYY